MPEAFASIGSNRNREHNIASAVATLRRHYGRLTCSQVYRSEAVGFSGEDFFNMVLSFTTQDSPQQIQRLFQRIEAAHGRTRTAPKFSDRTLDIDLILYGDMVIATDGLCLPRADIADYAFVLLPLSEIAPQHRHPLLGYRYDEMWQRFPGERGLRVVAVDLDGK